MDSRRNRNRISLYVSNVIFPPLKPLTITLQNDPELVALEARKIAEWNTMLDLVADNGLNRKRGKWASGLAIDAGNLHKIINEPKRFVREDAGAFQRVSSCI